MLFPMKRFGRLNYFKHTVQIFKKINIDKNNLYMTCTQNWVLVSYNEFYLIWEFLRFGLTERALFQVILGLL